MTAPAPPTRTAATAPAQAGALLARAAWAARAFAGYDRATVARIVDAAAGAGAAAAGELAERTVRETGSGVVADEAWLTDRCTRGLADAVGDRDLVGPRADPDTRTVALPRPAGVLVAHTPADAPVAGAARAVLLALLTRNAVVISPEPGAGAVAAAAARALAAAAVAAGAPDGAVQWVERPGEELAAALAADPRTGLVLSPAGPGNVPVLVDATADPVAAAARIAASVAFDNGVLPDRESMLIAEDAVAERLLPALQQAGAHLLDAEQAARLRAALFPGDRFDPRWHGRSAAEVAAAAGLRVDPGVRVLLAPVELAGPEEPLAHPKPCPVLGVLRVPSARRGIAAARLLLRIGGAGHSAAVHSNDPAAILAGAAALAVRRLAVNVGGSLGGPGAGAVLAPPVLVGGRPVTAVDLTPELLVSWTRIAGAPPAVAELPAPAAAPGGPVPPYPHASNTAPAAS